MKTIKTPLVISSMILFASLLINIDAYSNTQCVEPIAPIVPDGIVASKDEITSASKALKSFQAALVTYRNCLTSKSLSITTEDDDAQTEKNVLLDRYNASIDLEALAASEFNTALRAYNK